VKNSTFVLFMLPVALSHGTYLPTVSSVFEGVEPYPAEAPTLPQPSIASPFGDVGGEQSFNPALLFGPADAAYARPFPPPDEFSATFQAKTPAASLDAHSSSAAPLESKGALQGFWEASIPSGGVPGGGGSPFSGEGTHREYADVAKESQLRRKGPVYYSLKINAGTVYDDNITLGGPGKRKDLQTIIGPAARIQLGSDESTLRLGASYAGAASWFSKSPAQRTYEQVGGLDGGWSGSRLKTGFRLGIQSVENGSPDVGERATLRSQYGGLTLTYPLTGKIGTEVSGDMSRAKSDGLLGSRENRVQEFLTYDFSPKLQIGIGSTQGVLQADAAVRQTYDQALFRVIAHPTGKLGCSASLGNEWRHFGAGEPSSEAPVFAAAATWQVSGQSLLSLEARRRTFASASVVGQNYEATDVSVSARQALSESLDGVITFGYERADYHAATAGVQANRLDNYYFSRLGLNWVINGKISLGGFYEISKNESSGTNPGLSYQRNRIGMALSFNF